MFQVSCAVCLYGLVWKPLRLEKQAEITSFRVLYLLNSIKENHGELQSGCLMPWLNLNQVPHIYKLEILVLTFCLLFTNCSYNVGNVICVCKWNTSEGMKTKMNAVSSCVHADVCRPTQVTSQQYMGWCPMRYWAVQWNLWCYQYLRVSHLS
jgi:hypothetical protein